jgi:hypothetical protein
MGNPIGRELFLERAKSRFGDKYDYSAIIYKSYKSPVKIKCRVHPVKEISITPEKHLQTTGGCKFCLREMRITMLERELQRPAIESPASQSDLTSTAFQNPKTAEIPRLAYGGFAAEEPLFRRP